jgi:4-hydroxyphenylpyruvate dioxygenase-like putative hemolysin
MIAAAVAIRMVRSPGLAENAIAPCAWNRSWPRMVSRFLRTYEIESVSASPFKSQTHGGFPKMPDVSFTAIDHVQLAMPPGGEDEARHFYGDILGMVD